LYTERVLRRLGATFCAPALTLDQSLDPPLLGLARVDPCLRCIPERLLPVGVSTSLRCAGSTRCTSRSALVDSHHLDGLLRSGVSGVLQPDADKVRCVSRQQPSGACFMTRRPRSSTLERLLPFPATRFIPFEAFPSPIAVPHHCGRCPPAVVVPCRSRPHLSAPFAWFVTPIPRMGSRTEVPGAATEVLSKDSTKCRRVSGVRVGRHRSPPSRSLVAPAASAVQPPPLRPPLPARRAAPKHRLFVRPEGRPPHPPPQRSAEAEWCRIVVRTEGGGSAPSPQ
jgi:hypothetical protein